MVKDMLSSCTIFSDLMLALCDCLEYLFNAP